MQCRRLFALRRASARCNDSVVVTVTTRRRAWRGVARLCTAFLFTHMSLRVVVACPTIAPARCHCDQTIAHARCGSRGLRSLTRGARRRGRFRCACVGKLFHGEQFGVRCFPANGSVNTGEEACGSAALTAALARAPTRAMRPGVLTVGTLVSATASAMVSAMPLAMASAMPVAMPSATAPSITPATPSTPDPSLGASGMTGRIGASDPGPHSAVAAAAGAAVGTAPGVQSARRPACRTARGREGRTRPVRSGRAAGGRGVSMPKACSAREAAQRARVSVVAIRPGSGRLQRAEPRPVAPDPTEGFTPGTTDRSRKLAGPIRRRTHVAVSVNTAAVFDRHAGGQRERGVVSCVGAHLGPCTG